MQFSTLLEKYRFEKYMLEITISTIEQGGITSQLTTYQLLTGVDAWGFPKYPAKTVILPPEVDLYVALKQFVEVNERLS